jgi:hypothetical protein
MANVADILSGSNDEEAVYNLYRSIKTPRNRVQALFVDAWELSEFIASDGFEVLFEQDRSIDEFAQLFADIGFPQVLPVFQRLKAVVPNHMPTEEYSPALCDHLTNNFDQLKELLYDYLDIADSQLLAAFGQYIRDHKEDFADQFAQSGASG